jgi:hypothetical protein
MSKKNKNVNVSSNVFHDIQVLNEYELKELYDISFEDNGEIWDSIECKHYPSLYEWAKSFKELNSDEFQHKQQISSKNSSWDWE